MFSPPAGGPHLTRGSTKPGQAQLFPFNQFGDLERCLLRPGNVHGAEGWRAALAPVLVHYRERSIALYFRADAAFAKPELYELLEAEDVQYAIHLPANRVLMARIGHLLTRPPAARRRSHRSSSRASRTRPRAEASRGGW